MNKMNAKLLKLTRAKMAVLTGRKPETVRRDGRLGRFDFRSVDSTVRYVAGHMLLKEAKK